MNVWVYNEGPNMWKYIRKVVFKGIEMECVKNKVEKVKAFKLYEYIKCDVHKFFGSLKCCSSVKVEIKK